MIEWFDEGTSFAMTRRNGSRDRAVLHRCCHHEMELSEVVLEVSVRSAAHDSKSAVLEYSHK